MIPLIRRIKGDGAEAKIRRLPARAFSQRKLDVSEFCAAIGYWLQGGTATGSSSGAATSPCPRAATGYWQQAPAATGSCSGAATGSRQQASTAAVSWSRSAPRQHTLGDKRWSAPGSSACISRRPASSSRREYESLWEKFISANGRS